VSMGCLERSESYNHSLRKVAFCRGRRTGIRFGCMIYHPAQSQGHIKAVTMARAVQKTIHNQRFCLEVI
jgi:hypothetical protein